jgi:UDP-N-acetylmuramoyl-tripeptide--D-alanyl-D-alanine ligase
VRLSIVDVLEATGGSIAGGSQVAEAVTSFHTDSREVAPGGLFFALKGAETDGHRFVAQAAERGASAVVVERRVGDLGGVAQVVVGDSWRALYGLAANMLRRVHPLVVGVTGSNGKTSTKEMAAAVLATRMRVRKTEGNLNTETGVPLTILSLEQDDEALVLEMAMQRAGEIRQLADLARPRVGVITTIGSVHMEFFASQEDLARAKAELVEALPADGQAVLNADDRFFDLMSSLSGAPVRSFGFDAGDVRGQNYRPVPEGGCRFDVDGNEVRLKLSGRHQARNALAALAAGEFAGVPLRDGAEALSQVEVGQRLQEIRTPAGYVIVDDAYNASPESMLAAFDTIAERPHARPLLAVLGEMRELGALADDAHRRVGRRAAEVFDRICVIDVGYGRLMAEAADADLVADKQAAARWVREHAEPGSLVLVKASHGLALDELVRDLLPA